MRRIDKALFGGRHGMVFMGDEPFATAFLQTNGEPEIERPGGSPIAMDLTGREGDLVAGGDVHVARLEDDRAAGLVIEEVPGLVIGIDPFDLRREIEHQEIIGVMGKDGFAVARTDGARPVDNDLLYLGLAAGHGSY